MKSSPAHSGETADWNLAFFQLLPIIFLLPF
jgi:hypothetical protein